MPGYRPQARSSVTRAMHGSTFSLAALLAEEFDGRNDYESIEYRDWETPETISTPGRWRRLSPVAEPGSDTTTAA